MLYPTKNGNRGSFFSLKTSNVVFLSAFWKRYFHFRIISLTSFKTLFVFQILLADVFSGKGQYSCNFAHRLGRYENYSLREDKKGERKMSWNYAWKFREISARHDLIRGHAIEPKTKIFQNIRIPLVRGIPKKFF